jgi:GntR family transcriptional regulator/MocR family aminotransferase
LTLSPFFSSACGDLTMPPSVGPLPEIHLDEGSGTPFERQIFEQLRSLILEGRIPSGARLPATRQLAIALGISRNPVMHAYEHLQVEGFLSARSGAGTRVVETLPDPLPGDRTVTRVGGLPPPITHARISRRGLRLAGASVSPRVYRETPGPFRPGAVAPDYFPTRIWCRLVNRVARRRDRSLSSYGDPRGHGELREAIADYLRTSRAVHCDAEQILVTAGSQQALDLVARLLVDEGDAVGIEDPGYMGARAVFEAAGARMVPLPVDGEGLRTDTLGAQGAALRVIYTTPSHQYPLGVTMTASRRLELMEHGRSFGAWILEDDYDSEFRYDTHPLPSMQGLDRSDHVLYIGTFSKILSPALRVGYVVLPPSLVDAFGRARQVLDHHTEILVQAALAQFISDGYLSRHVRRMRAVYRERRDALREAVDRVMGDRMTLGPSDAGIHVVGLLPAGSDDGAVSAAAGRRGIDAPPLSRHYISGNPGPGLVLGYGATPPEQARPAVELLERALDEVAKNARRTRHPRSGTRPPTP